MDPANSAFSSYNGMLFGTDDAGDPTDLLLVPEGMEGAAVLSSSMATVPACVFSRCTKLSAIVVPTGSTVSARFATENGILYTADKATLLAAPAGLGASATIAPECVTITSGAFLGNEGLKTIVAPGEVADIAVASEGGEQLAAFNDATLQSTTVLASERAAWEAAGFTNFADPIEPGDTAEADGFAYTLLDDYTLAISWAGESTPPADLEIPSAVMVDGIEYAVSAIAADGFAEQPIRSLSVPDGIASISERAFAGCADLASAQLAGSVTSIGASAFEGCEALTSIELGAGLRTIADRAFAATALRGIFLPASLDAIRASAFAESDRLTTIVALGPIADISPTALSDVSGVSVYVPFAESDQSAWLMGAPAAGNHLLPYGVRMSAESYSLKIGESADIFSGEGYQHAPGEAHLELAYKAKHITVDETGIVVAKQAGTSSITASIVLNGRTLAVATCSVEARQEQAAGPQGEAAEGATDVQPEEKPDPNKETTVAPDVYTATLPLEGFDAPQDQQRPAITDGAYLVDAEANKGESAVTDAAAEEASEDIAEGETPTSEDDTLAVQEEVETAPLSPAGSSEAFADRVLADHVGIAVKKAKGIVASKCDYDKAEELIDDIEADDQQDQNAASSTGEEDDSAPALPGMAVADLLQLSTLVLSDSGAARASSNPSNRTVVNWSAGTTKINPNGGTLRAFYIASTSNKGNWEESDALLYHTRNKTDVYECEHLGGGGAGESFHTSKQNKSLDANENYWRWNKANDRPIFTFSVRYARTGYTFNGYTDADGEPFSGSASQAKGESLTVQWSRDTYTVDFDKDGGTGGTSSVKAQYRGAMSKITPPTKTGYKFLGYFYTDSPGSKRYYDENGNPVAAYDDAGKPVYPDAMDQTLYAHWEPIEYSIEIAGSGTIVKYTIEQETISLPTPSDSNKTFAGWKITGDLVTSGKGSGIKVSSSNTTSATTGTAYIANDPIMLSRLNGKGYWGNARFEPIWRCKLTLKYNAPLSTSYTDYAIRYFYSGYGYHDKPLVGSDIKAKMSEMKRNRGDVLLDDPPSDVAGYEFGGFYHMRENDGDIATRMLDPAGRLTAGWSIPEDTNWYTHWDAIEYTITLDPNGGTLPAEKRTITYEKGQSNVPLYSVMDRAGSYTPTPAYSNLQFVGWRCVSYASTITDSWALNGTPYPGFYTSAQQYGDYTLKAVWRQTLTFDMHQPTKPIQTQVEWQDKDNDIYFYSDYGFSWSLSPSFPKKGETSASFVTNLFTGGRTKPTINDAGWKFCCIRNAEETDGTVNHNKGVEIFGNDGSCGSAEYNERYLLLVGVETLHVHWEPEVYTITLDANTGVQSKTTEIEYAYGDDYDAASGMSYPPVPRYKEGTSTSWIYGVPIPTKEGWKFAGYYTGSGNNETLYYRENYQGLLIREAIPASNFAKGVLAGNITLKAKWQRDIPLHPNGGAIPGMGKVTATYGGQLPAPLPVRSIPTPPTSGLQGVTWTFRQYAASADDRDATVYYDKEGKLIYTTAITSTSPEGLYAQWERRVALDNNGGEGVQETVYVMKGEKADDIKTCPKREGYVFTGFYTERTGGAQTHDKDGKWTGDVDTTALPATIYAHYEGAPAYIVFDANPPAGYEATGGPERIEGKTDQKIEDRTLPSAVPTVPDYVFSYWSVFPTGVGRVEELPEKFSAGTTTYYANYEAKPDSKVIFNTAGDSYGGGKLSYYDDRIKDVMEYPMRPDTGYFAYDAVAHPDDGYEFAGWYEGDTLLSTSATWRPQRPDGGWPAETTYTAKFQQKMYTITYRCAACNKVVLDPNISDYHDQGFMTCKHISWAADLPTAFKYGDIVDDASNTHIPEPVPYPYHSFGMMSYYEFTGWSGTDVSGMPAKFSISTVGDKVFTINSRPREYHFTLCADRNGSELAGWEEQELPQGWSLYSEDGKQYATRTYTIETGSFELPIPRFSGHTFQSFGFASVEKNALHGGGVGRIDLELTTSFTPKDDANGWENGVYGDLTYDAFWSDNPYQITYELSDELGCGTLPEGADNPLNYDYSSDNIVLPIPSRVGYDFLGWTEQSVSDDGEAVIEGDSPQIDVTIPTGSWGDRIYKAHWRAHEYNVRYDLDGGSWNDAQLSNPIGAIFDADVTIAPAPKKPGYLFRGYQMRTEDGVQSFTPGQVITRPNWVAEVGEPAYEGVLANKGGEVVITALWKVNISVDVIVGSEGVHMGLERKADSWDPFTTTRGEAVLKNYTDAPVKVTGIAPSKECDYGTLKANALQVFRGEQSLGEASFSVRPERGTAANTQRGRFALADPTGGLNLQDDAYLNGNPAHTFPLNWMMAADGTEESKLRLYYELDMGELKPEDVDLSRDADLQVADLVYTVALVCP